MFQANQEKRISVIRERIARAEERVRKLRALSAPGSQRLLHSLTNSIRKHRRELHTQLTRQADVAKRNKQLLEQKEQMEQAQRNAPRDDGGELPQRQDQEARTDPLEQGFTEGQ